MLKRLPLSLILLMALCCSVQAATFRYSIASDINLSGMKREDARWAMDQSFKMFAAATGHNFTFNGSSWHYRCVSRNLGSNGPWGQWEAARREIVFNSAKTWNYGSVHSLPFHELAHAILKIKDDEAGHLHLNTWYVDCTQKFAQFYTPPMPKPEPEPEPEPEPIPPPPKPEPTPDDPVPKDALWKAVRDRMREENGGKGVKAADINAAVRHLNKYIDDWKKEQK